MTKARKLKAQSPLDNSPYFDFVKTLIEGGETNLTIVNQLEEEFRYRTSDRSIGRFRQRHQLMPPPASSKVAQTKVDGDEAEIRTKAQMGPYQEEWRYLDDPDLMLTERGLSPEDWYIEGATVNEWDGPSQDGPRTYHQAKLHIKRKRPEHSLLPARSKGFVAPRISAPAKNGIPDLIAVVGDQQAPFHDRGLHEAFCAWLEANKPDRLISLGDSADFPDISRHRLDPENTARVNECIQSAHDIFHDYRSASLGTEIQVLAGNHDERLRNILLDKPSVNPLYGVKQADTEDEQGEEVLAVPHLMRLDELNIEYVNPQGAYDLAQITLGKNLAVRHGWIARQGSGVSALATLEHLGYSVIVGHTHRQSIVYKTTHDIDGETTTLTAAEAGCMCKVVQLRGDDGRTWPNFTPLPDWQQGFSTVQMWPDGKFRIDNATYVTSKGKGSLLWRDQCYTV